jgi:hypothetical protein
MIYYQKNNKLYLNIILMQQRDYILYMFFKLNQLINHIKMNKITYERLQTSANYMHDVRNYI